MKIFKVVTYVPLTHADIVRKAIGEAGGGKIAEYSFCSFSSRGTGRFLPGSKAKPTIGKKGKLQKVREERIEFICTARLLPTIAKAIRKVHPYEEPAIDATEVELL